MTQDIQRINELKSYTEYNVSTPTSVFTIGFQYEYNVDKVNVYVDDVEATSAGYTVQHDSQGTITLTPAVPTGVVRLARETDIDASAHTFSAGAKFTASNMDDNFQQIRHTQQEVRDNFFKLKDDIGFTNLEQTLQAVNSVAAVVNTTATQVQQDKDAVVAAVSAAADAADTADAANTAAQQVLVDVSTATSDVYAALDTQQTNINDALTNQQTVVNNSLAAYVGGRKAYQTLALAQADQGNLPANTAIEVTNDGANNGTYQWNGTALTKSAYDPLTQAKDFVNANPMFKATAVVVGDDVNNFTTSGMYTLSGNISDGQIANWPQDNNGFHQAGTILVQGLTVVGVKLATQIFFPYVAPFEIKVRKQLGSNGAWETSWSTLSTYEKLSTVFASKAEAFKYLASPFNSILENDYFGKKYSIAEMTGTSIYSFSYYAGFNSVTDSSGAIFNKIKAYIYSMGAGETQFRVYLDDALTPTGNGYAVDAVNQEKYAYKGYCKNFPQVNSGSAEEIELDQVIAIPANTPFVIVFRKETPSIISIARHASVSGNLENRGFNFSASTADWGGSNISVGNPTGFAQAGFQLLLEINTGGSSDPEQNHIPDLVLPPKIYAIPTYDSNIYLEHLTLEDHTLYEYDITCSKGWHRKRGWWWKFGVGDATAEYPLSISVHDKQTGSSLATASSVVKCTALSANAGAKKVLAIGDSLLVSGDITQQLLDMSATDVMKVELIGTRGTGLNKHEGRGGWTINDYTTAGRTYYQFTVSGVTALPAINATTYTVGTSVLMVQEVSITGGAGTILCNLVSGSAPSGSGTLTKSNASAGDATIAFSAVTAVSGNPFWNGSAVNFANYLSVNSFSAPDIVFIQLGVNDTFGMTSDAAVESFTTTAFANLDTLINSIKAVNATIKVAVCAPPVYASQDAFGENYACGQTAWRAKRNIVTYNKKLYERYKNQEASRVYVVGSGVSMDTLNNFPYTHRLVNAFNTDTVYMQTNAVHPAKSGYQQIGVSWFAAAKAI